MQNEKCKEGNDDVEEGILIDTDAPYCIFAIGQARYGMVVYNEKNHSLERFLSGEVLLPTWVVVPEAPASLDDLWESYKPRLRRNNVKYKTKAKSIKLYVDYKQEEAPDGWLLAKTGEEALYTLATGKVTHLDLEHDLGNTMNGDQVLTIMLSGVKAKKFRPPEEIKIHTANIAARPTMEGKIREIEQWAKKIPM